MSPALPPETLDAIIDHLQDERDTLKTCCTVSKSWVPRTRNHLFAWVRFNGSRLEEWKKIFPDPSNSPAHHTRSLYIYGVLAVTADWIRAFHNVEHLWIEHTERTPLVPFYALSPAVKSLHLAHTTTDIFDLICSFPLLEDLVLFDLLHSEVGELDTPSTSPKFTGYLDLNVEWGLDTVAYRLCTLPNGLRFTKITMEFGIGTIDPIMDLVSACSNTLESLTVNCFMMLGMFPSAYIIGQYLIAVRGRRIVEGAFP